MNRHMLPDGHLADGPGLFEIAKSNGENIITNVRRLAGTGSAPGRGLINTATVLLGLLDGGLFAVSLAAQYQYIFHAKHQHWPAIIEAIALDAGMVIFSLLALGLARGGQSARVERALILACSFGSAGMNYAAADITSPRSVLAYTMPPVFLAVVTDRVIAVVRRHMLGMDERSAWAVFGRVALVVLAGAGKAVLYGVRLVLAPRSTLSGARSLVLLATPLPGAAAVAVALDPVRAALDDDLRELRDRYAMTAANLNDGLRAAQEAFRTEAESVRKAVRTETQAVRDAARTEADGTVQAAFGAVRTALSQDLRELRERHADTAADLSVGLAAAQEAVRTEIAAVREALRTETEGVRDTFRTEIAAVREAQAASAAAKDPPAVDRDAVVAELASQIRDAISSGERWTPDYSGLMTRTGYGRSWCEKAVRDARTRVFDAPDRETADTIRTGHQSIAEGSLS